MTNREKYKEDILDIACEGEAIAFNKKTNKLVPCGKIYCTTCLFYQNNDENNESPYDCNGLIELWCKADTDKTIKQIWQEAEGITEDD